MRYNNQLTLPFMQESEGETQLLLQQGTEASNTSPCTKARPQWRSMRQSEQNFVEPPCTDPYARWCGRGRSARTAPIPIRAVKRVCERHPREKRCKGPPACGHAAVLNSEI